MKKLRIIIDIIMFTNLIILSGYHITGNKTHEILGTVTLIIFIIHHILNIKWYKALPKGKYNKQRIISTIIDFLLFIDIILIIISSIMISTTVFSFLNLQTTMFARDLHLVFTAWSLILVSIHLGLHLIVCLNNIRKKIKGSSFEYSTYLIALLLFIYGVYVFIKTTPWKELFLLTHFKFYNYNQLPIFFYLEKLGIVFLVIILTYSTIKIIEKERK